MCSKFPKYIPNFFAGKATASQATTNTGKIITTLACIFKMQIDQHKFLTSM